MDRLKIPTQPHPKLLIIRQPDGIPKPNSGTDITQPSTLRIGNHLDRAVICEVGSFAGEDLVIPHRWLKEHQYTIYWRRNSVSFHCNNCLVQGCFVSVRNFYDEAPEELVIRLLRKSPKKQLAIEPHPF
jgi:hypothetical protein